MPSAMKFPTGLALAFAAMSAFAQAAERTGEEIVKAKCAACHAQGLGGAPRIDDRIAWSQRMKHGLDATVRSAIKGHGRMPARGGQADLTDSELRAAILYLFNPAGVPAKPAPAPALAPNQRNAGGMEIHLGTKAKGEGTHHVNITLRDGKTHAPIGDAQVEVTVTDPVRGPVARKLERVRSDGVVSYGGDFSITGREPHTIVVQVRRPGSSRTTEARFDFRQ